MDFNLSLKGSILTAFVEMLGSLFHSGIVYGVEIIFDFI